MWAVPGDCDHYYRYMYTMHVCCFCCILINLFRWDQLFLIAIIIAPNGLKYARVSDLLSLYDTLQRAIHRYFYIRVYVIKLLFLVCQLPSV